MKAALSRRLEDGSLWVLDRVVLDEIKTRKFVEILKGVEVGELVVLTPENGQSRWQADKKEKDDSAKKGGNGRTDRFKMRLMGGGHGK